MIPVEPRHDRDVLPWLERAVTGSAVSAGSTTRPRAQPAASRRAGTAALHLEAVERVIATMRERLDEPLTLRELAQVASFSPFHFDRLFRRVTGLPPGRFLTMLRMEAARRMLLTTSRSVTDISLDVGYNSIGTFTYQFTEIVGLSPSRLRRLAGRTLAAWEVRTDLARDVRPAAPPRPSLSGWIDVEDEAPGPIFVGLFRTPIPEGRPLGCTVLAGPGTYRIASPREGRSYLFAASFPWSTDPVTYLLPDPAAVRVATSRTAVDVDGDLIHGPADLLLRPARTIDPPLLVTLPMLLAERHDHQSASVG